MKLGRSLRPVPRGSTVASTTVAMHDGDVSEPLLSSYQSSNLLTDYYAQTKNAPQPPGVTRLGSTSNASSRTICSPQHPSQDLIEMLNRNQQLTLIRDTVENRDDRPHHQQQHRTDPRHTTQILESDMKLDEGQTLFKNHQLIDIDSTCPSHDKRSKIDTEQVQNEPKDTEYLYRETEAANACITYAHDDIHVLSVSDTTQQFLSLPALTNNQDYPGEPNLVSSESPKYCRYKVGDGNQS